MKCITEEQWKELKPGDNVVFSKYLFTEDGRRSSGTWADSFLDQTLEVAKIERETAYVVECKFVFHRKWLYLPNEVEETRSDLFCSCESPQLVPRSALYKPYQYCTVCRKERI